jgi:leader peptidase (prepilin peptidase)/N-methyltransferase
LVALPAVKLAGRHSRRYSRAVDLLASEVPGWFVLGAAFVFGSIWGSFFNVAIYRWPREMSVVRPASQCPGCGAPVAARYNVPILGFLFLRGKTACCGTKLSARYPMVEALSGVLCMAIAQRFILGVDPETPLWRAAAIALCYFAFVGGLIIATFVDLEHMQIPDEVSLPGAALGLASAALRDPERVADFAFGAGVGFLLVQLVFVWSYEHLFGRRGMGEGDSKLLMMIGAFLGYQGVLFAMFAGAVQGLIAFVVARLSGAGRGDEGSQPAGAGVEVQPGAAGTGTGSGSGSGTGTNAKSSPSAPQSHEPEAALQPVAAGEDDVDLDGEPGPEYWGHVKLPFGPFLALGALEFLFFGDAAIDAWIRLIS